MRVGVDMEMRAGSGVGKGEKVEVIVRLAFATGWCRDIGSSSSGNSISSSINRLCISINST